MGYEYQKEKFDDCVWVENGELIGIITDKSVANPVAPDLLNGLFTVKPMCSSDTGVVSYVYRCSNDFMTIMTTEALRKYIYEHGFWCDNIYFVRMKRSSGSSRVGKCLFINERLYSRLKRWDACGLQVRKGMEIDLAAYEAYIALTLSSIIGTVDIQPENILLIDDYVDTFGERVVATRVVNDRLHTEEESVQISNSIWDGQSLMDSSVFNDNGYGDKGMLLLRNRFFKSCCFNTNIDLFFRDNGIKKIEQLNGYTTAKRIEDIKLITTPSSIKYLKFGSFDKWLQNLDSTFGVVKFEKPPHYFQGDMVTTHYQLLNTLQMTQEEVSEFLKPSVEYIEKIKNDPAYLRLHIGYTSKDLYPKPYRNENDVVYTIMGINEDFSRTRMYCEFKKNVVRKLIKQIKSGKVFVNGNYSTLLGNPVEMLTESIGLFNGETMIGIGKVHSQRFKDGQRLLGSRSPHVTIGNIWLMNNTINEKVCRYFNLTKEIICINSIGESILDRLSGADFDSDTAMITDNHILINAAERNYNNFKVPANLVKSKKTKRYYTPAEQCDLDVKTSVNKIGEIINLSQELNSMLWHKLNNGETIDQIQPLYRDICQLDIMSNLEIDKAKKEFVIDNVRELKTIREKYLRTTQDGRIIKPYFFAHVSKNKGYYDNEKKCYQKMDTTMDYVQKVMNKIHIKVTEYHKRLSFIECLSLSGFKINRVKYDQLYKIVDMAYRCRDEITKIWNDKGCEPQQKIALTEEAKIKCYDYINNIKLSSHTMYYLMSTIDKVEYSKISSLLLNLLLMNGHSGFYSLLKASKSKIPVLERSQNGDIDIFGIMHDKIYN